MRFLIIMHDADRAENIARAVTQRSLQSTRDVRVFRTRATAMAWAREVHDRGLVVITELHLEVPNAGLELLHQIRGACPGARLHLIVPQDRFLNGVEIANRIDERLEPGDVADVIVPSASRISTVEERGSFPQEA
ncbi:MAG: hypothetical protein WDA16_11295 [Candidatus Thermoplasmatota archaeon]